MKILKAYLCHTIACGLMLAAMVQPSFAQNKQKEDDGMSKLLDYSRPGANHKLLDPLAGKWHFQDAKLSFVKGTLTRKPIYNGRFYMVEITGGKLPVPVAGGKMKLDNYQEMHLEGYDNARKKFVATSINNHIGSDIQMQFGEYDPSKKAFIYTWSDLLTPGNPVDNKRVLRIVDANHYVEEYFEVKDGHATKVRELDYERLK